MPDLTEVPVGQPIELEATVTVDGTPTDPTNGQAFTIRGPDGTVTNLGTGTNQGGDSGIVTATYDAPSQEGDYWWSFESTTPKTWQQHQFVAVQDRVHATGLADIALTSLVHARVFIKRKLNATIDPELVELLINGYSEAVMDYCDRRFKPVETAAVKIFDYGGNGLLDLAPWELRTATSITTANLGGTPTTLNATSDYVLTPRSKTGEATYHGIDFVDRLAPVSGGYAVTVTGDWGSEAIPYAVEIATLIAVADGYRNPEGGATRAVGELEYTEISEPADTRGRALPADARALLDPFVRYGI